MRTGAQSKRLGISGIASCSAKGRATTVVITEPPAKARAAPAGSCAMIRQPAAAAPATSPAAWAVRLRATRLRPVSSPHQTWPGAPARASAAMASTTGAWAGEPVRILEIAPPANSTGSKASGMAAPQMAKAAAWVRARSSGFCAAAAWRTTPFWAPQSASTFRSAANSISCEKTVKPLTGRKLADSFSRIRAEATLRPKKAGTEARRPRMRGMRQAWGSKSAVTLADSPWRARCQSQIATQTASTR